MIFRLSFIHGLYMIPGWYIIRDFSGDSLVRLLTSFFSAVILFAVFQIRLRKRINGRTDGMVSDAQLARTGTQEFNLEQSFDLPAYRKMNLEVMFSYLRPWLTTLCGLAFLALTAYAFLVGADSVRLVLSALLTLYFLAFPWVLFYFRVNRAFRNGSASMEKQGIRIRKNDITVTVGGIERRITALSDIAVTRSYLLLYTAGSNYIQLRRELCSDDDEMTILSRAAGMVEPA